LIKQVSDIDKKTIFKSFIIMTFTEFPYQRPVLEDYTERFVELLDSFAYANTYEKQEEVLEQISEMRNEFETMNNLCRIRHSIDTANKTYEEENTFFDINYPQYEALNIRFYNLLVNVRFKDQLEQKFGSQLFTIAELNLKTFKPEILGGLRNENCLKSEYTKLRASARIQFNGAEYNLSSILPLEISTDRATRKAASEAKWDFYVKKSEEVEGIYDSLVRRRHNMAVELGYSNFVELGYARMLRSEYNAKDIATFRELIHKYVVPVATELRERQAKRIGLDKLKYYDEGLNFKSGNPNPKGEPTWIVDNAKNMYGELSNETNEFFNFMLDNDLLDLVAKKDKAPGGYCSFINKYKAPFIFSNFNGTSGDIDVLTHEAGHAFQVYSSRDIGVHEYAWPTFEACEIHSMSMEFFTWPWMNSFFEEDTDKYKFLHLSSSLTFLCYGSAIDEFQHFVYENPDISTEARNQAWRKIEKKYMPYRDYDGYEFLEKGGFWQRQGHLFSMPFYYIDYVLAQICAFQFWLRDRQDHDTAWQDYVELCKAGGSQPFLELVKLANLQSPFDESCIQSVVKGIKTWLDSVDDADIA